MSQSATQEIPSGRFAVFCSKGLWLAALTWGGLLPPAGAADAPAAAARLEWARLAPIPDERGVAAPFAGVCGDALVVAGGANFPEGLPWEGGRKVWHDAVRVLDKPDGTWREAGRLPGPRAYGVGLTLPAGLLCIGGSDSNRVYADVFLLAPDAAGVRATPWPALPQPVANACGAVLDGTVYVLGGESAPGASNTLCAGWSLDPKQPERGWQTLPPWPGPGRALAFAAVQSKALFLAGGYDLAPGPDGAPARRYLRDGYRYEPAKRAWRRIADLPHPVVGAPSPAPAVGQSHVLVLGGDDGSRYGFQPAADHPGFPGRVLAYHTITDTWVEREALPTPRVTLPVVAWRGGFVLPSGEMRPGVRSPEVWTVRAQSSRAGFGLANYITLVIYLAAMVWLGGSFARRNRTTDDFFRGGQRIPWWAAGVSIFATMLSSITFMAIPAQAYSVGWNLFLSNSYLIITPLVVAVFLPFYRSLNLTSAYEYLERRFNTATRLLASALFILFQCGRVAIVLYLPALALSTVSSMDVNLCIVLMGVLCVIYTVMGGIEAVIWTDFVQAMILMGGALWALVTIVLRVDGGAGAIVATAAEHGKFFQSVSWSFDYTIAAGWIILLGSIFNNLFPYTASQDIVQRYVTTPDERGAARAIWTNAIISAPAQAVFFAIGTALFVFYRQHPERLDPTLPTDAIFPLFIVRELPAGVAGLIVAGVFAAAQSTLAGSLNSIATAYVTDFHRRFRPQTPDRVCLTLARWITAVVGGAGTLIALILARSDVRSLWETFLAVIGLFGGTISALFLLGIFSRRAHGTGALVGALASAAAVGWIYAHKLTSFWCYPIVGVVVGVGVGWLASLLLPGPRQAPDGLTIRSLRKNKAR